MAEQNDPHAAYEAEIERQRQEHEREAAGLVDGVLSMSPAEHIIRAAQIYAAATSHHDQGTRLLTALVELGFAVAKGQAGASYSTPPQDSGR